MSEAEAPAVVIDYAESGMTDPDGAAGSLQALPGQGHEAEAHFWGGLAISTADRIPVPKRGEVEAEFLSIKDDVRQGST